MQLLYCRGPQLNVAFQPGLGDYSEAGPVCVRLEPLFQELSPVFGVRPEGPLLPTIRK